MNKNAWQEPLDFLPPKIRGEEKERQESEMSRKVDMCVWRVNRRLSAVSTRTCALPSLQIRPILRLLQHTTTYYTIQYAETYLSGELAESLLRCSYRSYNIYHYLRYSPTVLF